MPSCEIITIGTELLLGEITDTNSRYMARALRDLGIDLYRKTTIGDNARRIAQAIQEALLRSDIIITTGGLGPTVDDPTREAVALAVGSQVEFRPELWEQIQRRFERFGRVPTENNKRQAYIPAGGIPVENAVGTAPAFRHLHERWQPALPDILGDRRACPGRRLAPARLLVRDDGPGVAGDPKTALHKGFGLSNTAERLRQLYGDQHQLRINNRPASQGGGLEIAIEIPARAKAALVPIERTGEPSATSAGANGR